MLTESARMSSAAEARFRIDSPNSRPRAVKVIALDEPSEGLVRTLAAHPWNAAGFFSSSRPKDGSETSAPRLRDLAGRDFSLQDAIAQASLVVMVATAGEDAPAVAAIGQLCSDLRIDTTGLIVGGFHSSEASLSRSLALLRPWMLMLVVAHSNDYVEDMLRALRA